MLSFWVQRFGRSPRKTKCTVKANKLSPGRITRLETTRVREGRPSVAGSFFAVRMITNGLVN